VRLFSYSDRPVHLGPYPAERLGRSVHAPDLSRIESDGILTTDDSTTGLARSIGAFLCALDAVRQGERSPTAAEIPEDLEERARHFKAAGYFLDSSLVGICELTNLHCLPQRVENNLLRSTSYAHSADKLRLRFNPDAVLRQMERSLLLSEQGVRGHTHAIVFMIEYPRDPAREEPGAAWITGTQAWRAALRSAETATVLANYVRILGYEACGHSATTSDVNLHRLAVSAGLALIGHDGEIANPFVGQRFGLAAVTTNLALAPDAPLCKQRLSDRFRAKGPSWWLGYASPKHRNNREDFARRHFKDSRFPVETLKRVDRPTTYIDEERIPRVPKSSEFFLRAAFGDLGPAPQEASKDGLSVTKAPLAAALRLALNTYSLLQRGEPNADAVPGQQDPAANADLVKATMHFLGADIAGISRAPAWVWYSHRQDGTEMPVAHPLAVSVMDRPGLRNHGGRVGR
jgi:hypothetical protein